MTFTEQMIDSEFRMIVQVDPILLADLGVDDEGAVIILMRVVDRLGDVVLRERGVGHIGNIADGNVADVVVFVSILGAACRILHYFRLLRLIGGLAIRW